MNIFDFIVERYEINPIPLPFNRKGLAVLFKELGYKVGVEIGVDRGLYSEIMSKANPGVKLYCIDPWKAYTGYDDIKEQDVLENNFLHTKRLLEPFNCEIIRKTSMEAVKDFKPESSDYVYIDGNHKFEYVLNDLNNWSKIVKKGGIIAGHDYKYSRRHREGIVGVGKAVDLYMKENNIRVLFLPCALRDSSWFFVNK
jgi:hypothetical protein